MAGNACSQLLIKTMAAHLAIADDALRAAY
jgi:hypothetical protein